jgi:hypothetical protein
MGRGEFSFGCSIWHDFGSSTVSANAKALVEVSVAPTTPSSEKKIRLSCLMIGFSFIKGFGFFWWGGSD